MTNLAIVFPGQGSQSVSMMTGWEDYQFLVADIYSRASDALGYDLWKIVSEGPENELNQTRVTQPAMLCAGVACWEIAKQAQALPQPAVMAGHSLGEYSALVCAGSIEFTDAVRLVAMRGELMQSAVAQGDGSMAAIIGLGDADVIKACESVTQGIVEAVNFNAPGQVVIAGNRDSVEAAMDIARELGAKRALLLPVSVPSHCSLMRGAADQLGETLDAISIENPSVPVIHNQNAGVAASVGEVRELLRKQLYQPVQWVASVQNMASRGVDTLVECGPGKVLTGLTKRIDKSMQGFAVFDKASLDKTIESISE